MVSRWKMVREAIVERRSIRHVPTDKFRHQGGQDVEGLVAGHPPHCGEKQAPSLVGLLQRLRLQACGQCTVWPLNCLSNTCDLLVKWDWEFWTPVHQIAGFLQSPLSQRVAYCLVGSESTETEGQSTRFPHFSVYCLFPPLSDVLGVLSWELYYRLRYEQLSPKSPLLENAKRSFSESLLFIFLTLFLLYFSIIFIFYSSSQLYLIVLVCFSLFCITYFISCLYFSSSCSHSFPFYLFLFFHFHAPSIISFFIIIDFYLDQFLTSSFILCHLYHLLPFGYWWCRSYR
jgi:hypothetical protein